MIIRIGNIDEIFDKSTKKIITNPDSINKKKMEFAEDGIYSPSIFGNIDCEFETYSCECGEFVGPYYKDFTCTKCGSKVSESTASIEKTGWIKLNTKIINPIMFHFVQKLIPNLEELIAYTLTLDAAGNEVYPANCIGLRQFYDKFDELIAPYKESKADIYNFVMKNRNNVFIDKIEVFSLILRPVQMQGNRINFDRINNTYNFILKKSLFIKDKTSDTVHELAYEIQNHVKTVFDHVLELMKGKEGIIRGELLGTRLNFTSRCVISPASSDLPIDSVILPYLAALELYRYHIIEKLTSIKGINFLEANDMIDEARLKTNDEINRILELIEQEGANGLINRNPTISVGSILHMNFKFKYDIDDLTMELNNLILVLLAADFDGDVLNIIATFDTDIVEMCKLFNPINFIIDRNTGRFNEALNLEREQVLGFNVLLDI